MLPDPASGSGSRVEAGGRHPRPSSATLARVPKQPDMFDDEVLGEFATHDPPRRGSKWCHWAGSFDRGKGRIHLGLGGDADGPERDLLLKLRELVRNIDSIVARAADALSECAPAHEISQFRLASISAWDEIDEIFELTFEAIDGEARPNVETTWPPGEVIGHRVIIGRDYRATRQDGQWMLPATKYPADYPDPPRD